MQYSEILENLNRRMLDFHQSLSSTQAYKSEITTSEFFRLTSPRIEEAAQNLFGGKSDPWLEILHLPHYLLYELAPFLHLVYWDTEVVAPDLFVKLEELFSHTPFQFQWVFDPSQQKLTFMIDKYSWSVPCTHLEQEELWAEPMHFTQLDSNLTTYLQSQEKCLYVPTGFDQVVQFMLVALPSIQSLKRYLIPSLDEREEWFHQGIPVANQPADIWLL